MKAVRSMEPEVIAGQETVNVSHKTEHISLVYYKMVCYCNLFLIYHIFLLITKNIEIRERLEI